VLGWLTPYADDDVVVAFDAPLVVRNVEGRRTCERMISRCFGARHAGAHSSNLSLAAFRDGVRAERLANELELNVNPYFGPRPPIRRSIEVYPHPAIVALFDLPSTLQYKAKRGRTKESRSRALLALMGHLESLADADPPLDVASAPRWKHLLRVAGSPSTGAELERAEDEFDAYVCAYIGAYYYRHGSSRCRVVGDTTSGYIVTPVTLQQAACLDAQAATLEVTDPFREGGALTCAECGLTSPPDATGWRGYLTDDGEAAVFCPECAAREFGAER
jgi:predicted RNase H-like nuclease